MNPSVRLSFHKSNWAMLSCLTTSSSPAQRLLSSNAGLFPITVVSYPRSGSSALHTSLLRACCLPSPATSSPTAVPTHPGCGHLPQSPLLTLPVWSKLWCRPSKFTEDNAHFPPLLRCWLTWTTCPVIISCWEIMFGRPQKHKMLRILYSSHKSEPT